MTIIAWATGRLGAAAEQHSSDASAVIFGLRDSEELVSSVRMIGNVEAVAILSDVLLESFPGYREQ